MINKRKIGSHGEDLALEYLAQNGYSVLDRNIYTEKGEIDIIAKDGTATVFVEVKYRRGIGFGRPEEAMTRSKLQHFRQAISDWCAMNGWPKNLRADVLAILETERGTNFELFKDVLT